MDSQMAELIQRKQVDKEIQNLWGNMEKETLKKYMLIYGYGRWVKIRSFSASQCKILQDKDDPEMKAFANDFVRALFENLQTEKNELKNFLLNLIDEKDDDNYVQCPPKDWGELIAQRATPWAKRLQLLHRVQGLIEAYKKEKSRYMKQDEAEQDTLVVKEFKTGNNLLNFLPSSVFYGQRPSVWWTLRHDIDLLIGTYKYGYANYQAMRLDRKLSFYATEKVDYQYSEFPNADNITRRLKKLVQIIGKPEY